MNNQYQEKKIIKETRPEKYLREIRDLQKQNNLLLEKLTSTEEKKETRRKFRIFGSIMMALLPYLFSLFVAWTFYTKVQDSVGSLQTFIKDIPSAVTQMFQGNIDAKKDDLVNKGGELKDKGLEYWNNLGNKNNNE